AGVRPLSFYFDRSSTSTAGLSSAPINPKSGVRVRAPGRTAKAGVGHDLVAGSIGNVRSHEFLCGRDEAAQCLIIHRRDGAERVEAASKTDFRLENVSRTGKHGLVQQRIAELEFRARSQNCEGFFRI